MISTGLGCHYQPVVTRAQLIPRRDAALAWIQRASDAASDGGISKGYDLFRRRWAPSYPETTGYTIPTLLNVALYLKDAGFEKMASSLAEYLLGKATPEGGVAHWKEVASATPIVFDTGQVMFGLLAMYRQSRDKRFLLTAKRSANWLTAIQDKNGFWKTNQHLGVVKVIDTRVAWALLEIYQIIGDDSYRRTAIRNLDWASQQQDETGWFHHCSFLDGRDPYTHTLAYTAEGLFESGILLGESRYIVSARKMIDALMARQRSDGSLAGSYASGWQRPSRWSCLTGNCQMAHLWLRSYETTGERKYYEAAQKAILFVARTQDIQTNNPNVHGAIAGSYPLYGSYERFKFPNWACKFFIDTILKLDEIDRGEKIIVFVG
jgi:uncharacterized protein YyaL (SSP411 family)